MQLKELESSQQSFYLFIGILGFICLAFFIGFILYAIKEYQKLIEWRNSLTKGNMVRVDSLQDKQEFWAHNYDGTVVLRMHNPQFWFKTVNITEIWPLEEDIEWEVVC